ncbi:MAG: dTDP-4-dehydrorhamnose 3,5-epimerase [Desulfovibrio sp.]|jgi:dTDP-4-dehydrorhamnose 3,5-epimerase|nr:dTDP-4-dehydrorhamnose 3,5-epimerase [Desulfovibrio sp.]
MDQIAPQPSCLTALHGVWLADLAEIPSPGGSVLHMVRRDSPLFSGFGEIYFSLVEPGEVKAWKRHRRQTQLFAVPHGLMEVAVHDPREDSPSRGLSSFFLLGRQGHYKLLRIPPGLWYGFACRGEDTAVLANCADLPHDPAEAERMPPDSAAIPCRLRGGPLEAGPAGKRA